ncbi:MAG: hypothetical protein ACOX2K_05085 [Bacillota bacterium]|jgi:hypothetical protein
MEIKWFEQLQRGQRSTVEKPLTLTFTLKPRGVRLNASLTRALQEKNIEYVRMGLLEDNVFVLSPASKEDGGLKVSTGSKSSSAVISSGAVGAWAKEHGLSSHRVVGEFDQELGLFKFPLEHLAKKKK